MKKISQFIHNILDRRAKNKINKVFARIENQLEEKRTQLLILAQ